ncbi:methyltransferase [Candidatus Woesearchaeota archaeon]|nr:methyltransferase [Candidatus Woesearchaeota archaeon]
MTTPVYEPDDDSYLLRDILEKQLQDKEARGEALVRMKFLDMGCGNGFLGFTAQKKGMGVTFVDINPEAIAEVTKILNSEDVQADIVLSDLFEKAPCGPYDVIAFNTPYLPADKELFDPALHGGQEGNETAIRFISQAKQFLAENGIILLLTSDLAPTEKIRAAAKEVGFSCEQIGEQKLFFEKLLVYKLQ